jgi:hypothetical protein
MTMRMLLLRVAIGVVVLGLGAPAAANAATPHPGPWHGQTKPAGGKDDNAEFVVKGNMLTPQKIYLGWSGIIAPTSFKCNEAFIQITARSLAVIHGHFSYNGTAVDTAGGKSTGISGKLTWTGTFTSPTTVKGTVRFQTQVTPVWHKESYTYSLEQKPCDTGTLNWAGGLGKLF